MAKYKLTYFDFDGGRGEPVRIALHAAGIDFEDERISFEQFGEMRSGFRFAAVPVLTIDGDEVTQSDAMCRYAGKLAGLYPKNSLQALYCDEAMGAVEDLTHYIVQTFGLPDDELRVARAKLADGWMSVILKGLDQLLERGGGQYFADKRLTVADLKVCGQTQAIRAGRIDYVPADIVERLAPGLVEHQARVEAEPVTAAYYASRS